MSDDAPPVVVHAGGLTSAQGPPFVRFERCSEARFAAWVSAPLTVDTNALSTAAKQHGRAHPGGLSRFLVGYFGHSLSPAEDELLDRFQARDTGPDFWAAVEAAGLLFVRVPKPGRPRREPKSVAQQTWPEFEAVVLGVFRDGPTLTNWRRLGGEVALAHEGPRSPFTLKVGGVDAVPDFVPLLAETHAELERRVMDVAGPRGLLLFNYCLARAREEPAGFTASMDELVGASGPPARGKHAGEERRREAWETLRLFTHIAVAGRRWASAPKRGQPDILATWGPLIAFLEVADNLGQLSPDGSAPPREVTLTAGPWLARVAHENPRLLPHSADVRPIAGLPDTQPRYVWLKAIGWALSQRWRVSATRSGEKRHSMDRAGNEQPTKVQTSDFTRGELLDYLNPEPHYADILASTHPQRAIGFWDDAVALLRQHGIIGAGPSDYREHGPAPWRKPKDWPKDKPFKPQGWQEAWLSQRLTIRPGRAAYGLPGDAKMSAAKARQRRSK